MSAREAVEKWKFGIGIYWRFAQKEE